MALTITLAPEVEAGLRARAEREQRTVEDVASACLTELAHQEAEIAARLRRFDEGMVRLRKTMGDQPPFPDYAYERRFAYED